jgi:large subunit ribosomal protein L1
MAIGKRLSKAREGVDREKLYPLADAIKMVKERAKAKFDETIEVAINLGVDPRHADQMVRGVVTLPNGTGRTLRVGVFARGAKADEAKAAGADVVGAEDLVEKVQNGTIDFRVEKAGILQAGVGKASFTEEKLVENIKALADAVSKAKPAGSKGTYIQRVAVSSSMGPGVKVEPGTILG